MTSLAHTEPITLLGRPQSAHKGALRVSKGARARRANPARSVARGVGLGNPLIIRPDINEKRRKSRTKRFESRERIREFTQLRRIKSCGHTVVNSDGVTVRCSETPEGNRAGFAGVLTCGSVWACPVCSAKISARRAEEVAQVLKFASSQGLHAAMMTFTVRHRKGQSLKAVWGAVSHGWDRVVSGREWREHKQEFGIKGYLRATEVTHGSNGWHVHIHTIVIYGGEEQNVHNFGLDMWKRWESGITKAGFTALQESGGFDVQILKAGDSGTLGRYLAKQADSLAQEATLGAFKEGRKKNRTPFQIAQMFAETGDIEDLETWHIYERESKGKRQLTWSRGLRAWAQLEPEKTDEDIASEETGSKIDDVVILPIETWNYVRFQGWKLLDIVELKGRQGLIDWLSSQGLAWLEPPEQRETQEDLENLTNLRKVLGHSLPAYGTRRAKP